VALAPREVRVISLVPTGGSAEPPSLDLEVTATKGYYVRSLARDLGHALGTDAHLARLRRTRSGPFGIEEAIAVADLSPERLIPVAAAARRALPAVELDDASVRAARSGKEIPLPDTCILHLPLAWLDGSGALVAIGEACAPGRGRVLRGFPS
jgi:tRNA pseudouridine55 synthase